MNRLLTVLLIVVSLVCSGCATGRITLIDIDLRSADQITAYVPEASVVYKPGDSASVKAVTDGTTSTTSVIWEKIMEVLKVVKGRLRIITFEW